MAKPVQGETRPAGAAWLQNKAADREGSSTESPQPHTRRGGRSKAVTHAKGPNQNTLSIMGSALSFRRPEPEPEPDAPDASEETRETKRTKAAPAKVLTVLQSSEAVTMVLSYSGAGSVLTLETLSATAHATVRGLALELEAPVTANALRKGSILAQRAELLALRRAGTLERPRLSFCSMYSSEPVTGLSGDVEHLREGVVRFASPRLPRAITTENVDTARSEETLDAHARLSQILLGQGTVVLGMTMQEGDILGQRNQGRFEGNQRTGSHWDSPPTGGIDDAVALELMQAMAPIGGPESLPKCLREAATRDYSKLSNQPAPDIGRLFDQVAAASAHLDAATLGRISTAFCWRKYLEREDATSEDAYASSFADFDGFLGLCQETGVSARVARSLWRDALRGSLLPFMPVYVKEGDLHDRPEPGLVRHGNTPLLETHFYFRTKCCARAMVDHFGGDPVAIFGRENEATLYRERNGLLFGCSGSLALECLVQLKSRGAPGAFEAAIACLTPEERLPCLVDGDSVLVAPEWADISTTGLQWERARFLRHLPMYDMMVGDAYALVHHLNEEIDIPMFALKRDYASDATPAAARVLCAAAAEGQNEILLRLVQAAPAFAEQALAYPATRYGDAGSALDYAISAGNVVGTAMFMGVAAGRLVAAGGVVRTTSRAFRTERSYLSLEKSQELRADMCAAVGMVANLGRDLRWRTPHELSRLERAAANGEDSDVKAEKFRLFGQLGLARVLPERWGGASVVLPRVRKEFFLATQAAAWRGHVSTLRRLLQLCDCYANEDGNLDDDAVDSRTTALQYAVFQGHADCVEAVLDGWGGDLGAKALRWAISRAAVGGHAHVLRRLRECGHCLHPPNETPELTPLGYAARFGQLAACAAMCEDPEVARALRERREDNSILQAYHRQFSSVLRVLLETARIETWDTLEPFPIYTVTLNDDVATMEVLLEYGYPVDRADHANVLLIAATKGSRGMVELLLASGARPPPV